MKIDIGLVFCGKCNEAISYYERVFGVKAKLIVRYRDIPYTTRISAQSEPPDGDDQIENLVRMAILEIGTSRIRLMDLEVDIRRTITPKIMPVIVDNTSNVDKYFKALSREGASLHLPSDELYFNRFHAIAIDKFGVLWAFDDGADENGVYGAR